MSDSLITITSRISGELKTRVGKLQIERESLQTVMIVDDSFNDLARLNTNYHALSSTIINYLPV